MPLALANKCTTSPYIDLYTQFAEAGLFNIATDRNHITTLIFSSMQAQMSAEGQALYQRADNLQLAIRTVAPGNKDINALARALRPS